MLTLGLVSALGAAAGALWWWGERYDAAVRRRHPPAGRFVATPSGARHVVGPRGAAGEALLLVHGANGTAADFPDDLHAELAADHAPLAADRPGHGHSAPPPRPLDLAGEAAALVELLDAEGRERAWLLGHSYGAAVVLRAALDAPHRVSGVLCVAPIGCVDERTALVSQAARTGVIAAWGVRLLSVPVGRWVSPSTRRDAWHPASPPADMGASRAFPLSPRQQVAALGNLAGLRQDLQRLHRDLARLSVPCTVLAAEHDRITPWRTHAAALAASSPRIELKRIADGGHWLPRTHVAQVRAALAQLRGA